MRLLFLSRWFPAPADNGSKLRIAGALRALARRHEVTLIAFADPASFPEETHLRSLHECCAAIRVVPYRPYRPASARALAGFFAARPRFLVDTHSEAMQGAVAAALRGKGYDLVVASELDMAPYAASLQGVPLLLEELELAVHRDASGRPLPGGWRPRLSWLKLGAYLRRTLPRFGACTVVSEVERAHLRAMVPAYERARVVPNAVDLAHYAGDYGPPCPNTLVFAGAPTYGPNLDAVRFFLAEAFPLVRREIPDAQLRVTGDHTGVDLAPHSGQPGVCFTGRVADVRPIVARSRVSIVPLRLGGGTRLKILESMALGTPVVATSKGAEGLAVTPGADALVADNPAAFAAAVVDLLRSPARRAAVGEAGRRLVARRYDWRVVGDELEAAVAHAAAQPV
jgi:glycosyltransferase involved in cell wall biosynthesis